MTNRDHMDLSYLDTIEQPVSGRKPIGLWVSAGHSWLEWVRSEEVHSKDYDYYWEVKIDFSRILKLNTEDDATNFTEKYGVPKELNRHGFDKEWINWSMVSNDYGGIYFHPKAEIFKHWCYAWDVESVCVWDKRLVIDISSSIKPL